MTALRTGEDTHRNEAPGALISHQMNVTGVHLLSSHPQVLDPESAEIAADVELLETIQRRRRGAPSDGLDIDDFIETLENS